MRGLRLPSIASMKKGSIISTGTRAFMFKSIFPGIYNKWRYNEDLGCKLRRLLYRAGFRRLAGACKGSIIRLFRFMWFRTGDFLVRLGFWVV